ncbi:hypothetical protein [Flavobacterium foetidum]|uniref:hypothetical protein n=1 Tax=Flavobacterium foetidum TaxID=2026681 RepID=UPI0010756F96|nr:hypothetical protein [Flavobacterium foetidum]KAF2516427.1 hypothetical protein E0W73_04880 [Flavobacterium foetidum]
MENIVVKIKGFQFRIENLIENQKLNPEIISKIEKALNLIYIKEENTNVCLANSDEVRPEFRQSFKTLDLLDYINAFARSALYKELHQIIMGRETAVFWKIAKMGSDLRKAEK